MADSSKKEKPKKINVAERRQQIAAYIQACETYLKQDPDPTAKNRVDALAKNPCASGMFYLNAIYKDNFQCSEEQAIEFAKKYRTTNQIIIPYGDVSVDVYSETDNGIFSRNSLLKFNGDAAGIVSPTGHTMYIDYQLLLNQQSEKLATELNSDTSKNKEEKQLCYNSYLDSIYIDFLQSTSVVARGLDSTKKYLEIGADGVYKSPSLLNWTEFKNFIDNQKNINKGEGFELDKSDYLDNWVLYIVSGPEKVYYNTSFKNLKKNAYKPNLDKEIKKIEDDVEHNGACPKYFKTWEDEENFKNRLEIELSKDPSFTENIKSIYISNGGIWVKDNPNEPVPTTIRGESTDKYTKLWEKSKQQYLDQQIKNQGYEYDEKNKQYCTSKELNPDWPYKALYIDTINYNMWEKLIEQLRSLDAEYSMLPQDEMDPSDDTDPKQADGKPYDPVCDKFYPIDYQKMFGLPAIIPPLWTVPVVDYDVHTGEYKIKFTLTQYDNWIRDMSRDYENILIQQEGWDEDGYVYEEYAKNMYEAEDYHKNKYPISDDDTIINWGKGTVTTYLYVWISENEVKDTKVLQYGEKSKTNEGIGINDGYIYVPIVNEMECEYTGIPIFKDSIMLPGIGFDYGTTLAGCYVPRTRIDKRIAEFFPYQNENPDGEFYWLQWQVIWPWELKKLVDMFTGKKYDPLVVKFRIFQKFKAECGFPKKCGEMTTEELNRNGVCGLEQFLLKPPEITPEMIGKPKYDPKEMYKGAKDAFKKWKEKLKKKREFNWDLSKRLKDNIFNKDIVHKNFMNMANSMLPAMGFIDTNCLKNTICEAQRKAQGEGTIKDLSDTLKNNTEATKLLMNDVSKSLNEAADNIRNSVENILMTPIQVFGMYKDKDGKLQPGIAYKLADKLFDGTIWKFCPRRFSDWLTDAVNSLGLPDPQSINPFTQLQNIFTKGIMGIFKNELGKCMKTNIITNTVKNAANVTIGQKQSLLGAFQSGDLNAMRNVANGTNLKNQLVNGATGSLNFAKQFNTPSFNMGKLNVFGDGLGRSLRSFNILNQSSDVFNLIYNLKNTEDNIYDFIKSCNNELKDLGVLK